MPDWESSVQDLAPGQAYGLLTALVVPRPIAWVSSISATGVRNLAPHSFFSVASTDPPVLVFTSIHRLGERKDSARNIAETGEFVVNVVDRATVHAMNSTSAEVEPHVDEFDWAGVPHLPSRVVRPDRVSGVPAALECRLLQLADVGNGTSVFGEVVHVHVRADVMGEHGPDVVNVDPVARLEGPWYSALGERFALDRPRTG